MNGELRIVIVSLAHISSTTLPSMSLAACFMANNTEPHTAFSLDGL